MNEEEYLARKRALDVRLKSAWSHADIVLDANLRAGWLARAEGLQAELIELENKFSRGGESEPSAHTEFLCPFCHQLGTILERGNPGSRAVTFTLPNHKFVGDGKFYCYERGRKIFQEPRLFQTDPASVSHTAAPKEPLDPWITYYNQLIQEWSSGERALVDEFYPDPPPKPKRIERRAPEVTTDSLCAVLVIAILALMLAGSAHLVADMIRALF